MFLNIELQCIVCWWFSLVPSHSAIIKSFLKGPHREESSLISSAWSYRSSVRKWGLLWRVFLIATLVGLVHVDPIPIWSLPTEHPTTNLPPIREAMIKSTKQNLTFEKSFPVNHKDRYSVVVIYSACTCWSSSYKPPRMDITNDTAGTPDWRILFSSVPAPWLNKETEATALQTPKDSQVHHISMTRALDVHPVHAWPFTVGRE